MKKVWKNYGNLYLIADFLHGEEPVRKALESGVDAVQLREKDISSAEYLARANRIKQMAQYYHTIFIVNDRIDIAMLSHADGVHLGSEDVPVKEARRLMGEKFLIGATAATVERAVQVQREKADYIGSGAWYSTETKKDTVKMEPKLFSDILEHINIPTVAIGGLTVENCNLPLQSGAGGIAVSAGILKSFSIEEVVSGFREKLSQFQRK